MASPRTPRWFGRRPRTALVSLSGLALVVLVAGLELGARLVLADRGPLIGGERTTFCDYDAELGWSHRPGVAARFARRDFAIDVRINAAGLRDRDYPVARSGKPRVLVLGDSFGWGYGVEHDERFDEILERRHPDWEIVNASVSGYGTDQQLLWLRTRGLAYRPDVVLLLFYRNDFRGNASATQYYANKPYFVLRDGELELRHSPVPRPSVPQRIAQWTGRTYFIGRALQGAIELKRALGGDRRGADDPRPGAGDSLTWRLLDETDRASRAAGARFALVSVPMEPERRRGLAEQAARSGFPYLALDDAFDAGGDGLTFPHDGHWNVRGHRVAADAVERFLLDDEMLLSHRTGRDASR